jgi:hypothetical protein
MFENLAQDANIQRSQVRCDVGQFGHRFVWYLASIRLRHPRLRF